MNLKFPHATRRRLLSYPSTYCIGQRLALAMHGSFIVYLAWRWKSGRCSG